MLIMRSLGKTTDQGFGKGGALTHCQENVEIRERDGSFVLRSESVSEERQIGASRKSGPVGAAPRDVLPIIEDCDLDYERFLALLRRAAQPYNGPLKHC
jgi:hypothetical protein